MGNSLFQFTRKKVFHPAESSGSQPKYSKKERELGNLTEPQGHTDSHSDEERLTRREEQLANAESNVLPHQRNIIRMLTPVHFQGPSDNDLRGHYNIGLFGMVNAGKSSLLNSIFYAVQGEYPNAEMVPVAPSDHKGVHTKRTYAIHITEHMCLVDTPGIIPERMRTHEQAVLTDIKSRLERGGFRGSKNDISKMRENEIHCAVVIISPDEMFQTRDLHVKLITLLENHLGSFPLAVITRSDISTPQKIESTRGFLRSKGISDIYEIENIHEEQLKKEYQVALLNLLQRCACVSDRKTTLPSDQADKQDD